MWSRVTGRAAQPPPGYPYYPPPPPGTYPPPVHPGLGPPPPDGFPPAPPGTPYLGPTLPGSYPAPPPIQYQVPPPPHELPYTERALNETRGGGTPYGASHLSGMENSTTLSADEKTLAQLLGRRVADLAIRLAGVR